MVMVSGRPMICSKCKYDLRGLPNRGGCPECGNTYNKDRLIGIASPDNGYQRSEKIAFWLKIACLVIGALMVLGCSGVLSYIAKDPRKPLITGGVICCMMVLMAIAMVILKYMDDPED